MKNAPKRLPSVTVRSPLGASPPTLDSQADSSLPTPPMETASVAAEETSTHSVVRTFSYTTSSSVENVCVTLDSSFPPTCFHVH